MTARQRIRLWTSNQPGAWVMVLSPAVAGVVIGGPTWRNLWLLLAWALCYCFQFTASRWLLSRRVGRYLPPALVYGTLVALVGVPLVVAIPSVLWWAPLFAALAGLSLLAAWRRQERSWWANAVDVLASGTMCLIAVSLGVGGNGVLLPQAGLVAAAAFMLTQYGSVLFVKTMIREFGHHGYYAISVVWHVALVPLGIWLGPATGAAAVALLIRAAILPRRDKRL
ncbi:YwiC-like family protein, partial [uncultured Bifidobacterium sp.]|uniref:YwiC-like family protein n=1 Tax=uncultured Bifidobacterium sp. TaxID=165187 RepID=UPI0026188A86